MTDMLFPCPRCLSVGKVALQRLPMSLFVFRCLSCGWQVDGHTELVAVRNLKRAYREKIRTEAVG